MSENNLQIDTDLWERLAREPLLSALAAELAWQVVLAPNVTKYLGLALPSVVELVRSDYAAVAAVDAGKWSPIGETGRRIPLPTNLLAEALDREGPAGEAGWFAAPLRPRAAGGEMLVLHTGPGLAIKTLTELAGNAALLLGQCVAAVRQRETQARRIARLEAMLTIAGSWNRTHEMEPLLVQMAEAATKLLDADRSSIFLWDRNNRVLVGRPALGVEGGELRIPDHAGVVGQVVQTGEPRRVDLTNNQEQIDRRVDSQLKYQTRTLLCVPLVGGSGELFGAFEVLNKRAGNFSDEDQAALVELAGHAAIALENTQERVQLLETRRQLTEQAAQGVRMIGQSPAIVALRSTIGRLATTELAVLILGENGTGKEVVSQSIHYLSRRRDQPFIAVNCAAISETLLESELFGHEKGAFTDAKEARAGKFELASGGTLFLDEIGDLSLSGQAKLLRVLEEKIVVRVGGSKSIHTDARVIAATNQNLAGMVRAKKFREDLYFRLNVVTLELPPLRDRRDDVLLLAEHFLADFCRKARRKPLKLSAEARSKLQSHPWPGNVRELRNLMERLAYLSSGEKIEAADLAFILSPAGEQPGWAATSQLLADATSEFQIEHIKLAIARSGGNMSEAAERLGLHRSNLYRKMRQLDMPVTD